MGTCGRASRIEGDYDGERKGITMDKPLLGWKEHLWGEIPADRSRGSRAQTGWEQQGLPW